MVRGGVPADEGFAEALDRVDDDAVATSDNRVSGEQHSGTGREHHALDHHRHCNVGVAVRALLPVGRRPFVLQRCQAGVDGRAEGVDSGDVEDGFVLTREAGAGRVLPQSRGTHRHRRTTQLLIAGLEIGRQIAGCGADDHERTRYPQAQPHELGQAFGFPSDGRVAEGVEGQDGGRAHG